MIITDINAQRKKGRYNLFVDNVFYSGVGEEAIVKNGLKIGSEITKDELEEVVTESEERSAFEKLISLISKQMYTKFEIKQKLLNYGFNDSVVNSAIKKAEEYGYVNDELYAKLLVDAKKNKSKLEIKFILYKKGINNSIICKETEKIDENQEKENAVKLADKYMKNKEINQKTIAGLYGYLSRKGFISSSVNYALKKYKFDEFEE